MEIKFKPTDEMLKEIPKERILVDEEFKKIYIYLKEIFEEKDERQKPLNNEGELIEEIIK
jgi:hypothetical protein